MTLAESTVLVADDEPVLRLTFSMLLQQTGARVIVASDGVEALHVLETQHVNVVLPDKQMPHMDGLTLLKELRVRASVCLPCCLWVVCCPKTSMRWIGLA